MEVIQRLANLVAGRIPVIAVAVASWAILYILPKLADLITMSQIPVVGTEVGGEEDRRQAYLKSARKLYNEGYQKFHEGVFRITTSRTTNVVVLSPKFLPELNKIPDQMISMEAAVDEAMETKYTKIESHVPIIPPTITGRLTPSLSRLNPTIAEEVKAALQLELPHSHEWTEVSIHEKLTRIVAMVSGRIFIGPELCRTEQYMDAAINYTLEVMKAQRAVQQMRPWLRTFLAQRLPEVKRLDQRIKEADEFLQPLVRLRREALRFPDVERPDDMLQWLMDNQQTYKDENSQNLAKVQLGLSFAAIHTTTLTATNAFYNIAAMPELVPELRTEIREALKENGNVFTTQALQSMKKVDSFLKETLRMHPATMAAFQRKVLQPFTLSNGQKIPAGVTIEVPAVAVHSDSDIFDDADSFDALRFYRLREEARAKGAVEVSALNQFVSVSPNSLTFGYGRHACPGRFFAANEIKMILANALLRYDIKTTDGNRERYPNIEFAHMSIPDSSRRLLFKEIQEVE